MSADRSIREHPCVATLAVALLASCRVPPVAGGAPLDVPESSFDVPESLRICCSVVACRASQLDNVSAAATAPIHELIARAFSCVAR